jgi:hypothetical protein
LISSNSGHSDRGFPRSELITVSIEIDQFLFTESDSLSWSVVHPGAYLKRCILRETPVRSRVLSMSTFFLLLIPLQAGSDRRRVSGRRSDRRSCS